MNVLITGASSDISKAMVEELEPRGMKITLTSSSQEGIKKSEAYWKGKKEVNHFLYDFCSPGNCEKEIKDSSPDILILNAWKKVDELKYLHEFSFEEIRSELLDNIQGNIELIKAVLPQMIEKKFGRIVFISSVTAISGTSKYGPYCMSKAALEGLIKNIAVDYGKYNITANTLRPGITKTERTKRFWEREYYAKRMAKGIPLLRLGDPEDIARAIIPLIDKNCYITGSELNVSGGLPLISTAGALKEK